MKKTKKLFLYTIFIFILFFSPLINSVYGVESAVFDKAIAAGKSYKWDATYNQPVNDDEYFPDGKNMLLGVTGEDYYMKVNVLNNLANSIDSIFGTYIDYNLNSLEIILGTKKSDEWILPWGLYDLNDLDTFLAYMGLCFFYPQTYTNDTATYDYFNMIYTELAKNIRNNETTYEILDVEYELTDIYEISLNEKYLELYIENGLEAKNITTGFSLSWTLYKYELKINVKTGIIEEYRKKEMCRNRSYDLVLELANNSVIYIIIGSVGGVLVIGIIITTVLLIKKKKSNTINI